jgi:hypothetical protein
MDAEIEAITNPPQRLATSTFTGLILKAQVVAAETCIDAPNRMERSVKIRMLFRKILPKGIGPILARKR